MALKNGSRLGPYEIVSSLGSGGMGEVYRARDTRLGRIVALKTLRADLSANEELRRRFEREARAVSSLNHPHICALYDIGHEEGVDFLILELLEGETLAERLKKGALPLEEVLRRAVEIAGALDSAHRCGVVHRDLKPGNIMLTKFGAKLLDFGLARLKPEGAAPALGGLSAMPTQGAEALQTAETSVVGTVPYMSPEQLEGKEIDGRSDIFSFGATFYEMLAGRRPFEGESSVSIMASILRSEPLPLSRLRPDVPRSIEHVVTRCLAKDPDERWQSARDVAAELRWIQDSMLHPESLSPSGRRAAGHGRLAWSVPAIAGIIALVLGGLWIRSQRPRPPGELVRFSVGIPKGTTINESWWSLPSISPDGRRLAFTAVSEGRRQLWIHRLDALSSQPLAGTEEAMAPFWSPDSRSIGFFAEGKLKTILVDGGAPRSLCDVPGVAANGSWGREGAILFAISEAPGRNGLYQVSASGGAPALLHRRDNETHHDIAYAMFPDFLPDGSRFLFGGADAEGLIALYLGSLDGTGAEPLARLGGWLDSRSEYASPGYLLGLSENTLYAQRFNAEKGRLEGKPILVAESVARFARCGRFSVSDNGVLVYAPAGGAGSRLTLFDRAGRKLNFIGVPAEYTEPRFSPDGRRLAVRMRDPRTGAGDIWVFRFPEGTATRMTSEPSDEFSPIWSPDGREIVFSSSRDGMPHLFRMSLADMAAKVLVPVDGHVQWACDWSADGRSLVYIDRDPSTWQDLWSFPLQGDRKPAALVVTRFKEVDARLSPDGRWLAYASDESGQNEVYIQPYPGPGEKRRVSLSGGSAPAWRGDGKELFYLDLEAEPAVMSVSLNPSDAEVLDAPRPLFHAGSHVRDYDVTKDGQRFVLNCDTGTGTTPLVDVVVNWTSGLPAERP
jgi:serine/threonine protein kinase/Tol biopolymer transport system component